MKYMHIESLVKKLRVKPRIEMYGKTLADTLEAQEMWKKKPAARRPNLWRSVMESKVTRYSAAAIVALAAAFVLLSPFGTSKNGGIVWADVVHKVHQMPMVIHKEEYLFREMGREEPGLEADTVKFDAVKYVAEGYGVAGDVFDDKGVLIAQIYALEEIQQGMLVSHSEEKYGRVSMPEDMFSRIKRVLTPRGMVDYFTSGQYTRLGQTDSDDVDVEGFETTDPNVLFPFSEPLRSMFPITDIAARIWIDVETSLPVSIEAEFHTGRGLLTGFTKLHGQWRAYDFQWNADIPDEIFAPNIPDGYTEFKVTDFIPAEAKAGLASLGIVPVGFVIWRRRRRRRTASRK